MALDGGVVKRPDLDRRLSLERIFGNRTEPPEKDSYTMPFLSELVSLDGDVCGVSGFWYTFVSMASLPRRRNRLCRLPPRVSTRPMLGWKAAKSAAVGESEGYAMADMAITGSLTSNGLPMK